jgi:non-ribosomal peptide synthetase component F
VLEREVAALYQAFSAGRPSPLPAPALQYADFAAWQRQWLRGPVLDEHVAYWKGRLAGAPLELDLPYDPAPAAPEPGAATRSYTLPGDVAEGLRRLGRKQGATLYMTLLAAFGLLLSRTSGQENLVVGTAVAGRDRIEIEGLIGLFINMLPIRLDLGGVPSFLELLARVREATLGAYMHQGLPFEKLVQELPQARSSARNPVFQVAFGVQNLPADPFELAGLVFTPWQLEGEEVRLELTLWIAESPAGLRALWTYDPSLFQAATIERWHAQLGRLLASVLANPEACILDLELLGEEERQEMESRRRQRESANRHRLRAVQRRSVGRS